MQKVSSTLMFVLSIIIATAFLCMPINAVTITASHTRSSDSHVCDKANFDYDLKLVDDKYQISFVDLTQDAFVGYVNMIWSTVIPNPIDPLGVPVPSTSETIRLQKTSNAHWTSQLDLDRVFSSLDRIDGTDVVKPGFDLDVHSDEVLSQVKLRFYFDFWMINSQGEHQMCHSPFVVL